MAAPLTLRRAVYTDCARLLDVKYKWLTDYGWYAPFPEFKMPEDPSTDIAKALAWKSRVEAESKGVDGGDDGFAVRFRDAGSKVYRSNINQVWRNAPCAPVADKELAVARWSALENACHECREMMNALHRNEW